jgi:hypothetical protein
MTGPLVAESTTASGGRRKHGQKASSVPAKLQVKRVETSDPVYDFETIFGTIFGTIGPRLCCFASGQARGGPRSVCEEKPALIKVTGAKWKAGSLGASGGRMEGTTAAVPLCGCPAVQQSMGHLALFSPADTSEPDTGAAWRP